MMPEFICDISPRFVAVLPTIALSATLTSPRPASCRQAPASLRLNTPHSRKEILMGLTRANSHFRGPPTSCQRCNPQPLLGSGLRDFENNVAPTPSNPSSGPWKSQPRVPRIRMRKLAVIIISISISSSIGISIRTWMRKPASVPAVRRMAGQHDGPQQTKSNII